MKIELMKNMGALNKYVHNMIKPEPVSEPEPHIHSTFEGGVMKITEVLTTSTVAVGVDLPTKEEVLQYVVDMLDRTGAIKDAAKVRDVIFEREKIMSTGIGKGFAFPHAKTDAVSHTVAALVLLKKPVEFQALDGQPVNIVFVLVGRENAVGTHLRLLSRVSRLMNSDAFREKLLKAKDAQEVMSLISAEEEQKLEG